MRPVLGAKNASGVANDAQAGGGFVAALKVAFKSVERMAYASNRGAGTVTVMPSDGEVVTNLVNDSHPYHVHADGRGNLYAVNKSLGEDDATGNHVTLIHRVS